MKKALPYILLIVMAVALVSLKKCRQTGSKNKSSGSQSGDVNRNRGFDRRTSFIVYTQHARCRMDCRHIDESEVGDIMKNGSVNYRKSETDATPCPTYALEGVTHDSQRVRIVFAQCDQSSKVVTVIDLDTEWECHCPGDDNKYKNRN
jgi:hypothetical protein